MRILIKNGLLITLDAQNHIYAGHDLLVEDGVITRLGRGISPAGVQADKVIDASDRLVVPGWVDAHVHSYDAYTKGLYEGAPLETWFPYANMSVRRPLTQRELYVRTLLTATEMLRSGVTTGYDAVTLAPLNTESVDTLMTAYRDLGLRGVVSISLLNKPLTPSMPYLDEIMPADVRAKADAGTIPPDAELIGFCRWMIDKWNGKDGCLHVALAPSAPQRCTDRFMALMDDLSREKRVPWHTHVLETKVQAVTGREFYGKTIVEHLAELGLLSDRLALDHGVWLNDHDMQLLAQAGTSVVHNPISNLKVASGIAAVRQMLQAGVNVALGTDNAGGVDTASMFETLKFAALLQEVVSPEFAVWEPAREVVRMATAGGAKCVLMQETIGSLEVGKRADLVLYDLNSHPFVPLNDPILQLVYSENGQSVDTVLVNGRVIMENKRILTVDEQAILEEAQAIGLSLQPEHEKARQFAEPLQPYLKAMYRRCVEQDVGINRFSGIGSK